MKRHDDSTSTNPTNPQPNIIDVLPRKTGWKSTRLTAVENEGKWVLVCSSSTDIPDDRGKVRNWVHNTAVSAAGGANRRTRDRYGNGIEASVVSRENGRVEGYIRYLDKEDVGRRGRVK